ncbi:MAG: hypothetical protein HYV09_15450 [Deltaproteobacteria bacterium]|nr:hypothetical protein [Deltaproteobacteria bacterium]
MTDAYRSVAQRPPITLAARGRTTGGVLAIGLLLVAFAAIFSTHARLTVSCRRADDAHKTTTCTVQEGRLWGRRTREVALRDPRVVWLQIEGERSVIRARSSAGDVEILATEAPESNGPQLTALTSLVEGVAVDGRERYAFGHAGGLVLDLQLLLAATAVAIVVQSIAFRRHRVTLDPARRQVRAVTWAGLVPLSVQRTAIAAGDRARVERAGGRTRLVIERGERRIVLADEDGEAGSLDEAAERLQRELEAI